MTESMSQTGDRFREESLNLSLEMEPEFEA